MTGQRFFQDRAVSIWNSLDKDLKNHGVWDIQVLDSYLLIFLSYYDAKESRKKKNGRVKSWGKLLAPRISRGHLLCHARRTKRKRDYSSYRTTVKGLSTGKDREVTESDQKGLYSVVGNIKTSYYITEMTS